MLESLIIGDVDLIILASVPRCHSACHVGIRPNRTRRVTGNYRIFPNAVVRQQIFVVPSPPASCCGSIQRARGASLAGQAELVSGLGPRPNDLPQSQRKMAERIHARETVELDTSHASFATRPTQVLELITNAASAI
jgi:hypothetical protein